MSEQTTTPGGPEQAAQAAAAEAILKAIVQTEFDVLAVKVCYRGPSPYPYSRSHLAVVVHDWYAHPPALRHGTGVLDHPSTVA